MLGLGSSLTQGSFVSDNTIGTVTIDGSTTPSMQTATSYSISRSGGADDLTFSWSVSPSDNVVISDNTAASPTITFPFSNTAHTVSCQVSSATAPDSPQTGNLSVTTNTTNVVAYASDFSSDTNGWAVFLTSNSAVTGNVDAEGKTDLLQWAWSADEGDSAAYIRRSMDSTVSDQAGNGTVFALSGEFYYDDADASGVSGDINLLIFVGGFSPNTTVSKSGTDQWHTFYTTLTAGASTPSSDSLGIGIANAGDIPTSGDKIYFKNIKFEYIDAS